MFKTSRTLWIICAGLGIALAILGNMMMNFFPSTAHNIDAGYGGPVFAFELAKSPSDLINVFGEADDPLRADRIAQMDKGNVWDFPFMLIYALFMAVFLWALRTETNRKVWTLFAGVALLSGAFDAIENIILLDLTKDLEVAENIGLLTYAVWGKFLAIWICTTGAGFYLIKKSDIIWRILGVITIIGAASILAAFYSPSEYGALIRSGVTTAWVIMLIYAITRSVKPRDRTFTQ